MAKKNSLTQLQIALEWYSAAVGCFPDIWASIKVLRKQISTRPVIKVSTLCSVNFVCSKLPSLFKFITYYALEVLIFLGIRLSSKKFIQKNSMIFSLGRIHVQSSEQHMDSPRLFSIQIWKHDYLQQLVPRSVEYGQYCRSLSWRLETCQNLTQNDIVSSASFLKKPTVIIGLAEFWTISRQKFILIAN